MQNPSSNISVLRCKSRRARGGTAFTLVELMISIALSLVLILGVNQIFTYTTQAVGAGEAINSDIRSSRAAQSTFANDLGNIVGNGSGPTDAGSIIISSRAAYGFRNAKDMASEGNIAASASGAGPGNYPTNNAAFIDLNGDGLFGDYQNSPGEVVWPTTYNYRNHRLDCLSFFSRGTFHRQTGNPGTFVDNMASNEAWVWYGHLWLPDNSGNYDTTTSPPLNFPTAGTLSSNPNNFFASQLVLGRMAMLLTEKAQTTTAKQSVNTIMDQSGNPQWFIDRTSGSSPTYQDLTPLWYGSPLNVSAAPTTTTDPGPITPYSSYQSRCDLASTSIHNFQQKLTNFISSYPYDSTNTTTWWWTYLLDGSSIHSPVRSRFQCNPFVAKPMQAVDMAHANPYFISGCSQFIVEYAGDFLTQDNDPTHTAAVGRVGHSEYGDVNGPGADGQIDFVVVNGLKQIAWYGMPRSTSGSTKLSATNGDVVPLRDYFMNMRSATTGQLLIRQFPTSFPIPTASVATLKSKGYPLFEKVGPQYNGADYSGNTGGGMTTTEAQTGYTCAFGPSDLRPKLIRITMTLEDPTGRLPDGQTYQYVFQVP